MRTLCPQCGRPALPPADGKCPECGEVTPPIAWIFLPDHSIPPTPGVGSADPRECPRCGHRLVRDRGAGGRIRAVLGLLLAWGAFFLLLPGLLLLRSDRDWPYLALAPVTGAMVLGVYARLLGLRRLASDAARCGRCGYLRVAGEERPEDERNAARAVPVLRWLGLVLLLPLPLLLPLALLSMLRGEAGPGELLAPIAAFGFPAALALSLARRQAGTGGRRR